MQVRVGCEFVQSAPAPVHTIVQVEPRRDGAPVVVSSLWDDTTWSSSHTYFDGFGNMCRRLTFPMGTTVMRFDAVVEVDGSIDAVNESARELPAAALPPEALVFAMPSRYCPSDQLANVAGNLFGQLPPGWARVQGICDWVHANIQFGYMLTGPMKTATDVFVSRQGVCRDFAHLAISFCRALNIPARYAFGYLPDIGVPANHDVMDFVAWMEVYLEDRWWTFDPRNNARRVGRVLIGRGRDSLDVAMITSFGALQLDAMTVWADEVVSPG